MTTTRWDRYTDFMQARAAAKIATVDDARRLAQRRVPLAVFDYIDGGAGSESTLRANRSSIEAVQFLPRMGVTKGWPAPELTTTVLGTEVAMPILLSPIGFTRMMDPLGDVAGARAAGKAGTIFTVSSMSGHTMAEVVAAATQRRPGSSSTSSEAGPEPSSSSPTRRRPASAPSPSPSTPSSPATVSATSGSACILRSSSTAGR